MHDSFAVFGKAFLPGKTVQRIKNYQDIFGSLFRRGQKYLHLWIILSQSASFTRWIRNFGKNDRILKQQNYIQILKVKVSKINFQHYEDASKEIRENVKAIDAEETDFGDEINDDNDDVVLL